jgi:hypothetical protein
MTQTRLKLTLGMIGLALFEGFLKAWIPGFPLTEVFAVQTMVFGGYIAGKTVSGVNYDKIQVNNGQDK